MLKVIANREIKRVLVDNQRFLLIRHGDDVFLSELYCPHMDHNLAEGAINPQGELVCPWHAYRFKLRGGTESQDRCKRLKVYPLIEKDGKMICEVNSP